MAKRGKKYKKSLELVDREKVYDLSEAVDLVKKTSITKYEATLDVAINLGVDPRHADQNVRGACVPSRSGKNIRVVVFLKGQKTIEAKENNADLLGLMTSAKISEGWLDFDQVIATPDMMGTVGRLGKVLGPSGLMPNPKLGSVTFDVGAARNSKAGRSEFRVDKAGIVHTSGGKISYDTAKFKENIEDSCSTLS